MSDITTILNLNPVLIAALLLGLIAGIEFVIIVKIRNIARSYSRMLVMKGKIMADGTVTLDEPDIIPFVQETICLMNQLENLLHYIAGYILNHPSTGWFKGYVPKVEAVVNAAVQQLASEEVTENVAEPSTSTVPTPEQPAQPVSIPAGA
ncbi:MAG: hypothetical protein LUQ50_12280 [Methanospirillum sp.]|uniref:hypothetical protein n=1 Tax=Methanospirillum sp. TaxID=45200 RepID=UPI002374A303|nr:hypothetical protein [Methanospirillum sp.]MDD1729834.1 hypothetical protein [Methanospirillum sp.]